MKPEDEIQFNEPTPWVLSECDRSRMLDLHSAFRALVPRSWVVTSLSERAARCLFLALSLAARNERQFNKLRGLN